MVYCEKNGAKEKRKNARKITTKTHLIKRLNLDVYTFYTVSGQPFYRLSGKWNTAYECHIEPDWLLIYRIEDETLELARTSSYSDLFRNLSLKKSPTKDFCGGY